jgi:hypothetical protein
VPTFRIAIVGAGPAGYFAAQALQNMASEDKSFAIDMIERLPTPWGLVRSGVAPDHPKIKTVAKVFEKVAKAGNFRLFGNVELGTDVTTSDLIDRYDAVIIQPVPHSASRLVFRARNYSDPYQRLILSPGTTGIPTTKTLSYHLIAIPRSSLAQEMLRWMSLEC